MRLLFIHIQSSSFVREDLAILSEAYEIRRFEFAGDGKPGAAQFAARLSAQLLWLLRELPRCEAVYGWFADYHMVLPTILGRLYRKPVLVAVGGFDAISLPTLDYGVALSPWRRPLSRFVLSRATMLLPVSPSLVYSENQFSEWPRKTAQGIRALIPDNETPVRVVPTGYNPAEWPMGPGERDRVVSTVGIIDSDRTLLRKGIDILFDVARELPDVRFRVVGVKDAEAVRKRYAPSPNVELLPRLAREHLVSIYHETSVYLQLSRAEGLPNVLCEAMLCGCVPVGSRVFGIPDGVGDAGFVVDAPHAKTIAEVILRALELADSLRSAARDHIIENFHVDLRRRALHDVLESSRRAEHQETS